MKASFICATAYVVAILALVTFGGFAYPDPFPHLDRARSESAKGYAWSLAADVGEGNWPRWNIPVVGPGGKLWAVQDSRSAWSSRDGVNWQRHESNAGWGERYLSSVVFFQNKLWVVGGRNGPVSLKDYRNDVWCSSDGADWTLQTPHAPWAPRNNFAALVHDGKLWVIGGGAGNSHDAWSSPDGANWTQAVATLPWPRDVHAEIFQFDGALWAITFAPANEVWRSADGVRWNRVATRAPWGGMFHKDAVVFDGKVWVLGGADFKGTFFNDVWSSPDGLHWSQMATHAPWSPRTANYNVVFNNQLWIFGGKNGKDDVWRLRPQR